MTLQGTMLAPIEAAAQEKGASPAIHDRNGDGTWSTTNWALLARRDDDERRLADAQSSLDDLRALKASVGRPKDIDDIAQLDAIARATLSDDEDNG